jgi:predicted N-acetyltransferase YhbS
MEPSNIIIRRETEQDHRIVETLIRESFWNVYRPGCLEHYVIHRLRDDPAFVPELDLVMEGDGRIIGQNMFMRAEIRADDGRTIPIMTMGPICITPELKRRGFGKRLLDDSLERAAALGCGALCFEGNIRFYGKSGFTYAREFGIRYHDLPEGADDSFFLCRELIPGYLQGVTGEYAPPEGYFCAEREPEEFARFDALFPPKEKKVQPGQLPH